VRSWIVAGACLVFGCVPVGADLITMGTNVPLRSDGTPGPERCPQQSRQVMEALELRPGESTALVELDANQYEREPLTLTDGPIESVMLEPMGRLGGVTRLYGRVWTSGPRVVIRYYWAQRAGGNRIPICAGARTAAGQLEGKPGKYPKSSEIPYSQALAFIVEDFL
jgi:hypothetical protein